LYARHPSHAASTNGAIRVAGALRVYWRGLVQLVWPYPLSGDYSAPQEPAPASPVFLESILGALMMVAPFALAAWLGIRAYRRSREDAEGPAARPGEGPYRDAPQPPPKPLDVTPLIGAGALWIMISYFPVSNIPALLPTIRAERFWYFPAIGSSLILGIAFTKLIERGADPRVRAVATALLLALLLGIVLGPTWDADFERVIVGLIVKATLYALALGAAGLSVWWFWKDRKANGARMAVVATVAFYLFQCFAARRHANDYTDDLVFWDATRHAVPRSAKAHLNYSVMKGARGDLEARLKSNEVALELAPKWPMASIYLGDTLCRLHRAPEAWPHYVRGFELAPNDVNLIALAMQCLWDEKMLEEQSDVHRELDAMKDEHPGTWLEYLARDILEHGTEHNGVDPKYRPRGYNEGPKE